MSRRELVAAASAMDDAVVEAPMSRDPETAARAEAALWAYYLEWSRIARVEIASRQELRQLGFLKAKATKGEPADESGPTLASDDEREPLSASA